MRLAKGAGTGGRVARDQVRQRDRRRLPAPAGHALEPHASTRRADFQPGVPRWHGESADDPRQPRSHVLDRRPGCRSEEHTSELQSLMRISYAVFCLKKKKTHNYKHDRTFSMNRATLNTRP